MANNEDGRVIRLQLLDPVVVITTDDYDAMVRELEARSMAGDLTQGDRVLARLLHDANYRYNEILQLRRVEEQLQASLRKGRHDGA